MRLRALAATLVLAALACPAAAQPDPLRERFTARLEATGGDDVPRAAYRRMWEVMDSLVLRELRRGGDAGEVNRALAELPGYAAPSEGDAVTIGRGSFYSELPRALPGYVVVPVRAGREPLLMGVYNFGVNAPGRVSLFARRAGAWRRTGVVDARFPVVPYLLPLADSGLAVVTLETFTGGDHQDGTARVWRVRRGVLEPLRTLTGEMKEPSAETTNGRVRIAFTRFPTRLAAPILGTRIAYVTTLSAAGAGVSVATEVANPWVEVVDRYYALAARNPAGARALLADPALARRLGTRAPDADDDGGDLRAGNGWLVAEPGGVRYRITSRRSADGRWRITAVEPEPERPSAQ
ncbi:MAG TPA: hypothetical protein VM890_17200 [Longimicrobium sp.]|nr:hypothetical protein [Longimicrobium sp.]